MISFSGQVKTELSSVKRTYPEKRAELMGFLLFCDCCEKKVIKHLTESEKSVERLSYLIYKVMDLDIAPFLKNDYGKKGRTYLLIEDEKVIEKINKKLFSEDFSETTEDVSLWGAFFSGAFMAAGYVSDPKKEYYAEIRIQNDEIIDRLLEGFADLEILVRVSHRDEGNFFYFKTASDVSELLFAMGDKRNAFEYLNADIEKKIRNDVNRARNCDFANAKKQARTAERQLKAAKDLKKRGFEGASDELIQTAKLRIEHPDMTIEQLGLALEPPVSKSGIAYRFKKIEKLVENSDK